MWRRGPRCDVCGQRLVVAAPATAPPVQLWGQVNRKGGSAARDLCLACRNRNDRAYAELLAGERRGVAELARRIEAYLRGAPEVDAPPAVVGSYAERFPDVPFVEVMGWRTAANHLAEASFGYVPGVSLPGLREVPRRYDDVLTGTAPPPHDGRLYLTGSVLRLADGDVALYWHSSRRYPGFD